MKRFFVSALGDPPVLRGDAHKHLSIVLRARPGDEVILCTGDGYDHICRVREIGRDETILSVTETVKNQGEPSVAVTLFMSVLKGDKNDWVVQKATELGVREIFPVRTRYVQAHDKTIKLDRLNRIAVEAAEQCGRSVLPVVRQPIDFAEAAERLQAFDTAVFPYENATEPSLKTFLTRECEHSPRSAAIFVGSEGGFAQEEVDALIAAGITPVTLGKRILRAETANIAVLSAVMYELGQWE